ncbi:MAG: hypothetical protein IIV72_03775 [Alistipes sp.]|nr:hypothetical protein [Alistipes sp.]
MKKFLVSAMAVLALAACSKFNENGNSAVQNGELEQSYVSITLASADMNTVLTMASTRRVVMKSAL